MHPISALSTAVDASSFAARAIFTTDFGYVYWLEASQSGNVADLGCDFGGLIVSSSLNSAKMTQGNTTTLTSMPNVDI